MITTIDGLVKKPGERIWYIASGPTGYYPKYDTVSPMDDNESGINYFGNKNNCTEQCRLMNNDNNK